MEEDTKKETYHSKYVKKYLQKISPKEVDENGNPVYGALGTASTIGMHMVSGPIVGVVLGYLCDYYLFGSSPYGIIIGFILGVFAGFNNVIKDAKSIQEKQAQMEKTIKKKDEHE